MKFLSPLLKTVLSAILFLFILINTGISYAQTVLAGDFLKGVDASSFTATPGYQSVKLNWNAVSFSNTNAKQAGYLIIYATSTPLLFNSPNGKKPDYAVMNGVVVPTNPANLPDEPATSTIATGLTSGITYDFMIVAYVWDGINESSYTYSASSTICVTIPPASPNTLNILANGVSSNSVSGSFNKPLYPPDGYLISYSKNEKAPVLTNGVEYYAGQTFEGDTILQVGNSSSFTTTSLLPGTKYYIHVYSYTLSGCTRKPVYSLDYLSNSITTVSSGKQDSSSNGEALTESINLEPNPSVSNSWLKIVTNKNDMADVSIFTIDGKYTGSRNIQLQAGVNRFSMYTDNFITGTYILKVVLKSGKSKTLKFLKL